ncbi:MAG: GGDEF domain-containing protein [Prevotella sp.]|nr:GGDEF domain-containing protein [Prevotella sp.]
MRKFRKLLGVIIAQSDAPYQSKLLEGILKQAFELNYDVAVFSTFNKDKLSDAWHEGDANIFSMINYSVLDGIIFVPDTLQVGGIAERTEKEIKKKFGRPVVSVDIATEGFNNIFTDDVQNVKMLISHLIEVHKLTDIAFMTGIKGHPHSTNRLTGYYEAMIEHGLPIDRSRVFYGDFWYNKGEEVVQTLLDDERPMPQAIACANDTMAISVCEALKAHGLRVPEDVAVTGYDSIEAGINYVPAITSSDVPAGNTGIRAVRFIHSLIGGTKFKDEPCGAEISVAKSCGCSVNIAEKMRVKSKSWRDSDLYGDFDSTYNFMLEALISEKDYEKYIGTLGWYTHQIGEFDHFYLCVCDNWDNPGETDQNPDYLKKGYTKKMLLPLHKHAGSNYVDLDRSFDLSEMLPALYERRPAPTAFYFGPLHFNDRCFGYSAISFGRETVSYTHTYRKWMRYVCASFESLRRQRNLQYLYSKMEDNAVTDLLTGIYNRNGFNLYAGQSLSDAKKKDGFFTLILGDMNNLKYVNDTFGHVEGDFAIKSVADAFRHAYSADFCYRIGGDEFLIVTGDISSREEIDSVCGKIQEHLRNINDTANKPYSTSVSLGVYFDKASALDNVEQAVSAADKKMFEEKERYKREEGFSYRTCHKM